MKTSEVLNKAADLIEGRGWARGYGWEGDGSGEQLCLEGGILAALGMNYYDNVADDAAYAEFKSCPAYVAVQEYLQLDGSLWGWNDSRRTAETVIETLRAVAVIEAAKEEETANV